MNVQDLMIRSVKTCCPDDSLDRAAHLMWEHDIGCVPILDDGGHPIAMLTDRDICMASYTQGRILRDIPVRSAMSASLYSVGQRDSLGVAESRMQEHQVRRLPVVDAEGRLAGLITMNDIAREALRERPHRDRAVGSEEVATTLAAVCRPRVCAIGDSPAGPTRVARSSGRPVASPTPAALLLSATAQNERSP